MQPELMKQINGQVGADGDGQASIWTASIEDVMGLATEADTLEAVVPKLKNIIPKLWPLQGFISSHHQDTVACELISHRRELIKMAGAG